MNTEDDQAIAIDCADDDPQHQRRQTELVGQQAAAARSRDCLKAIAVRLKRISEAPRPCDHDNIGANPYLCPTLEVEGGLLSVTIDGLLSRVEQHANEVARRIKAGERGDENLIDRAVTLQAAIRRTEKRVQLLDEDLRYGVWGWFFCPADGGGKALYTCSPSSTCAVWTDGPTPTCTCARSGR